MSKVIDLTGKTFGKLTVLSRAENDKYGKAQWLCQCQCGNQKIINGASLRKGLTQSCGCQKLAKLKQYNEKNGYTCTDKCNIMIAQSQCVKSACTISLKLNYEIEWRIQK